MKKHTLWRLANLNRFVWIFKTTRRIIEEKHIKLRNFGNLETVDENLPLGLKTTINLYLYFLSLIYETWSTWAKFHKDMAKIVDLLLIIILDPVANFRQLIGNCTKVAWWLYKSGPTQAPFVIIATGCNYIRPRTRGFCGLAVIASRR